MFPKNTLRTVTMEAEPVKTPLPGSTEVNSVVYVIDDKDQQVCADRNSWGMKRATIYACAVVLVTLSFVAITLGAVTLILMQNKEPATSDRGPITDREHFVGNEPNLPDPKPPIKIDDGGLWPSEPAFTPDLVTPDLVVVDGGSDENFQFDEINPTYVDNDVFVVEGEFTTAPDSETLANLESSVSSSSYSESAESQWDTYEVGRTYISSSFPFNGYYMRGGQGVPSWEESQDSQSGTDRPGSSSGDGDQEENDDDDDEGSGSGGQASEDTSPSYVSSHQFSSESHPDDTFSNIYYDSLY